MPHWTHLVFEFGIYALFIICFRQAWKAGRRHWLMLLGAVAFGLIAESLGASPRTAGDAFSSLALLSDSPGVDAFGYYYGDFIVDFSIFGNSVPVCVGFGWAIILYAAHRTVKNLKTLTVIGRPFLAASIALTIDLVMDPVASNLMAAGERLPCVAPTAAHRAEGLYMWCWFDLVGTGRFHWFNVPLPNFMGWFLVIFITIGLSMWVWHLAIDRFKCVEETSNPQTGPWWKDVVLGVVIVFLSVVITWISVNGFHWLYSRHEGWAALFLVVFLLIPGPLLFIHYLPVLRMGEDHDYPALAVVASFQLFFTAAWLGFGLHRTFPVTLVTFPLTLGVSGVFYLWPYRDNINNFWKTPLPDLRKDRP